MNWRSWLRAPPGPDPPTPRESVEARLEAGEPIVGFLEFAASGPVSTSAVAGLQVVATLSFSRPAIRHMTRRTALAVTDRRVFFVGGPNDWQIRVEPLSAVRVLSYEPDHALHFWLNVDGLQHGYVVGE